MDPQVDVKMHIQLQDLHYFDSTPVIEYNDALAVYKSHIADMDTNSSNHGVSAPIVDGESGNDDCMIVSAPFSISKCNRYEIVAHNLFLIPLQWWQACLYSWLEIGLYNCITMEAIASSAYSKYEE